MSNRSSIKNLNISAIFDKICYSVPRGHTELVGYMGAVATGVRELGLFTHINNGEALF